MKAICNEPNNEENYGISIIPTNSGKIPLKGWKQYQSEIAPSAPLSQQYNQIQYIAHEEQQVPKIETMIPLSLDVFDSAKTAKSPLSVFIIESSVMKSFGAILYYSTC